MMLLQFANNSLFFPALLLLFLSHKWAPLEAAIAEMGQRPNGNNPLLYSTDAPIMHLDADTFSDTVFRPNRDKAYLVEFYKDWCGYCRRFAPFFKVLSESIKSWPFVQVAAINCADAYNVKICRANDIPTVPKLKYFPRSARTFADGQVIEHSYDSAMEMREKLHQKLMDEFHSEMDKGNANFYLQNGMPYERKCRYASLCRPPSAGFAVTGDYALSAFSYDNEHRDPMVDPWLGVPNQTHFLVHLFEQRIKLGLPVSLKLLLFKPQVEVRRLLVSSPSDVQQHNSPMKNHHPVHLPYVTVLERGRTEPIMAESLSEQTLPKLQELLMPMLVEVNKSEQAEAHAKQPVHVFDCFQQPDRCKALFFVSETDMLKAIHTALLDEVISSGGDELDAERFNALQNFLELLIQRFPRKTFDRPPQVNAHSKGVALSTIGKPLSRSLRAVSIFEQMKHFLKAKEGEARVSMDEWKAEFERAKREHGDPFPVTAEWEHCKGTRTIFRGFTCGLWTSFHAMTVQAYLGQEQNPLKPLRAIQGWVQNFFSCSGCRRHFMAMTTEKFPMDENNVRRPEDVVIYLWRAHNMVNKRLHGDEATEDPQFLKQQFPPPFLCPECLTHQQPTHSAGTGKDGSAELDPDKTLRFLLHFSTNIKPSSAEGLITDHLNNGQF